MKGKKSKICVFEGGTVKEELKKALKWCKKNNGHIATLKEIYDLKEKGKIPTQWYGVSTVYYKGNIRKAKLTELENIEEFYNKDGRLLFLSDASNGLYGNYDLYSYGRFVGVVLEARRLIK